VLIVVGGSSGLGQVAGISSTHPAGLLKAFDDRPSRHVILLAPWYAATSARRQAHVTIAAHPSARICVLPLLHHPLTLTLLGAVVVESEGLVDGWSDPGEAVQLLNQSAARSRSLVWHPRLWGLHDPKPTLGQLVSGLFTARGYYAEVGGPAGYLRGRAGFPDQPGEVVCAAGELPSTLRHQLAGSGVSVVGVSTEPHPAYMTKGSVAVTGLVRPLIPAGPAPACPSCSASLLTTGCAFCGCGPRAKVRPARQPVQAGTGGSGRSAGGGAGA
jgi:hypothetical protein